MNIFELLIFALLSAILLALGEFLSKRLGTAGWLVGIVPVAMGWTWVLFGAIRGAIADLKHSVSSRPVCRQGKCRPPDYVLVSSSPGKAVFRCGCGDLYISKANLFLRVLPDNSEAPYMSRDSSGNWCRSEVSRN
jgi:hypothetical protein